MVEKASRNGTRAAERLIEAAREAAEEEKFEDTPLARLLDRMAGAGTAKVFRVRPDDGKLIYACSFPVGELEVDKFEETVAARCGGGDFVVRFQDTRGLKTLGSIEFGVDPGLFAPKKTNAEVKREGGPVPQSIGDLLQIVQATVSAAIGNIPRPEKNDDTKELVKFIIAQQERQIDRLEANQARLIDAQTRQAQLPPPGTPKAPLEQVKEVLEMVKQTRAITEEVSPGLDDRRGLGWKLIDGPVSRGLERGVDKLVDRYFDDDGESKPKPRETEGVKLPKKTRPLSQEELAAWRKEGPPSEPAAPKVKEIAPAAVVAEAGAKK